ncbi:MAG TPA: hypothetical protein VLT51_09495, partial [Anaerolineales bacterium]|nr:hypothetical protein [Anaerolineales bacterium]
MKEKEKPSERERRDWVIILIILLFGFLCVILAGERAVRFSPDWKLNTNMMSNLDPDSNFLTDKPVNLYEPLNPAILTQPAWASLFLTPGAVFETGTPLPPPTNTPLGTNTPLPTLYLSPTALLPSPTNTLVYFPPPPLPTSTPKKPPPPTATTPPTLTPTTPPMLTPTTPPTLIPTVPPPIADLQITKTDGVVVYKANDILNYTIVVTNNGPSGVTNATVQDTLTS